LCQAVHHPHTGFHYSKPLTRLCHDYVSFSNISGMNRNGSEYRQFSNLYSNYSRGYTLHFNVNVLP